MLLAAAFGPKSQDARPTLLVKLLQHLELCFTPLRPYSPHLPSSSVETEQPWPAQDLPPTHALVPHHLAAPSAVTATPHPTTQDPHHAAMATHERLPATTTDTLGATLALSPAHELPLATGTETETEIHTLGAAHHDEEAPTATALPAKEAPTTTHPPDDPAPALPPLAAHTVPSEDQTSIRARAHPRLHLAALIPASTVPALRKVEGVLNGKRSPARTRSLMIKIGDRIGGIEAGRVLGRERGRRSLLQLDR